MPALVHHQGHLTERCELRSGEVGRLPQMSYVPLALIPLLGGGLTRVRFGLGLGLGLGLGAGLRARVRGWVRVRVRVRVRV